jgi:hypothetical protein
MAANLVLYAFIAIALAAVLGGIFLAFSRPQAIVSLDRRIIYGFVALCVLVPLIRPLGLKFSITEEVRKCFDTVDKLPAGTVVVISSDYGGASMPETHPMYIALLHHCFRKKLRPIIVTMVPDGPGITSIGLRQVLQSKDASGNLNYPDLVSGQDYVYAGFKPNAIGAIQGMAQSFTATFPTDYTNKSTLNMPIFKAAPRLKDVGMVFDISSVSMPEYWVTYGTQRTGVPLAVSCTAVSAVQYYPFYKSGQFVGLVNGMKGAAEYEKLVGIEEITGVAGDATKGMDAQSCVALFMFLSIVLANTAVFVQRRQRKGARQ